jgi:demethylmenaquinone methyltransferase / 2-methoxy-6-polyprenyl-1,4-benzoquinol methylase
MTANVHPAADPAARPPHAPLTDYYGAAEGKDGFVLEMFDSTAQDYDRMERVLALGTGAWYRGKALERAGLTTGMRVLDVAVGTGLVAREAARIVGDARLVTGIDPSAGMLDVARHLPGVQLLQGRAESLPFADASFDFLCMGYALRHLSDLRVAFAEFLRVLKPGGRVCILEISAPRKGFGRALLRIYMRGVVPALAFALGSQRNTRRLWRYYWDTIEACVPPASVAATLTEAGFDAVRIYNDVKGIEIFSEYQGVRPA